MPDLERLRGIAETEFLTVVRSTTIIRDKLRVVLIDGSSIAGKQEKVRESTIADDPDQAVRQFLTFAASKITTGG